MPGSRIPSPARSQGVISTPRKHKTRRTRSVCSPARSNTSVKLSAVIPDSFRLSPMPNRQSVLNDVTDIEVPGRQSWWKKLDENSRDVMEVLETRNVADNNVAEEFDVEVLSQENKNYTLDLPESSDGESISSIVIPQRKLFTQKDHQSQKKFSQFANNRENLAKLQKSHFDPDRDIDVGPKNLFNKAPKSRTKPAFPAALLNISANKTANKTKELPAPEVKGQVKSLFGNRPGTKRKNMFAEFIVSESEDEIPEIQPKVFGFQKNTEQKRRPSTTSRGPQHSPTSSITDIEMDDWKLLPSSTMVENQLEEATTPVKRARLSKLTEGKESENITNVNSTANKTKQSNKSASSKNKSKISNSKYVNDEAEELVTSKALINNSASKENVNVSLNVSNRHERSTRSRSKLIKEVSLMVAASTSKKNVSGKTSKTINKSKQIVVENAFEMVENHEENQNLSQEKFQENNEDDEDFTLEYENDEDQVEEEIFDNITKSNKSKSKSNQSNETSPGEKQVNSKENRQNESPVDKCVQDIEKSINKTQPSNKNISAVTNQASKDVELMQQVTNEKEKVNDNNKSQKYHNKTKELSDKEGLKNNSEKDNNISLQNIVENKQDNNKKSETQQKSKIDTYEKDNQNNGGQSNNLEVAGKEHEESHENNVNKSGVKEANRRESIENRIETDKQKQDASAVLNNEHEDEGEESNDDKEADLTEDLEREEIQEAELNEDVNESDNEEQEQSQETEHNETDEAVESENENQEQSQDTEEIEADEDNATENDEQEDSQEIEQNDIESENEELENNEAMEQDEVELENDEHEESQEMNQDKVESENEDLDESQKMEQEEVESENEEQDQEMEQDEINNASRSENEEHNNSQEIEQDGDDANVSENEGHNESSEADQSEEVEEENDSENEEQEKSHMEQSEEEANESSNEEVENETEEPIEHINSEAQDENDSESENASDGIDAVEPSPNTTHDTTGRNRKKNETKVKSPEAILHDKTNQIDSFTVQGPSASIRKTKSMIKNLHIRPSLAPVRESTGFSDGTRNSSAEGSGWDSHRTTRKTLRQTFGKDFTPRKSLRAMVMEKSAKRQTNYNEAVEITKIPQANSTELPEFESYRDPDPVEVDETVDETQESDHEASRQMRQTTLELYLQKIKQQNLEKRRKMEEEVRNSLKTRPNEFNPFKVPVRPAIRRIKTAQTKPKAKPKQIKSAIPLDMLPAEVLEDIKYKPPKRFRPSNASWATKRLYKFLESKLEPKYDYKARVRAEKLVETIYNFTKDVRRHDLASSDAVDVLKHEMARLDIVKTHFEFYDFFHEFMPREIRIKVVPDIVNKIPLPKHGVFADIIR